MASLPNAIQLRAAKQATADLSNELENRLNAQRPSPLEDLDKTNQTNFSGSATGFLKKAGVPGGSPKSSDEENVVALNRSPTSAEGRLTLDSSYEVGTNPSEMSPKSRRTTHFAEDVAEDNGEEEPIKRSSASFWQRGGEMRHRAGKVFSVKTVKNLGQLRVKVDAESEAKTAIVCMIAGLVLWFITSSVLLVLFGWQYDTNAVAEDRARYADITAERAAAYAATVLAAGLAARDALDYAIKSKLYFEPLDYEAVRATLEPVFGGFALLRSVDLAFSDRDAYITMRRMVSDNAAVGSFMSMESTRINELNRESALAMQSSAENCASLGSRGCLAAAPAQDQRWYGFASHLWAGEEADGLHAGPQVFSWDDRPGFVPQDPSRALATSPSVEWLPAYSLLFRIPFPGSRGQLSVFGRSVIELSELRVVESLRDTQLGASGAIYICDRSGRLLAAMQGGNQVKVTPNSGVFRFRYIYELEASWSSKLKDFDGTARNLVDEQFYVVVQPLSGRGLSNFSAVVAAEHQPFIDTSLSPTITAAQAIAIMPYPFVLLVTAVFFLYREHKRKQNAHRGTVLKEGIESLRDSQGDTLSNEFPEVGETMNALRKRTLAKTILAHREAEQSMMRFLEESAKPGEDHGHHLALVEHQKPI